MPKTEVVFFAEEDGKVPALEWLADVDEKLRDRFIVRIERLAEKGNELRRPEADFLRDGIYELRVRHRHMNYRLLYFFAGQRAVLSHGLTKIDAVPDKEIERAIKRKTNFIVNPDRHTYVEE